MIYLKSPSEITKIRKASQVIGELLDAISAMISPGVSTWELDKYAESFIHERGGKPAFKGYKIAGLKPFPGTLCTSPNSCIVHGIPSKKVILKEGDIIGIDVGVIKDGFYGDAARTYAVGQISAEASRLMEATRTALFKGIQAAVDGARVGDISHAIGSYIASQGYYPADDLTGHGVGRMLHEDPQIPNSGKAGYGPRLRAGMTLAIEPMVNIGTNRVIEKGWEFFAADGSLSAHYEHSILVTDAEAEILTKA
ncbi:MAG: type I methionyl aminopeptidase [Candidatus Cloacimonadaceae bacterium]|jgi:methionyl aminopeptidase|nr:type I methionyl aminopeptidase [Candidatus Cloacimonadota bacterium]MDY0127507.1 type I methionyl aminopeptidase [Candidatus Cloacimonadaceae bacterium]MCB5254709.1 type I methionyl aminopeptidase [Candidatus Cloacimonadota bacterium]MCK9177964.1 type I methionyl aminopeptidase [Candidatus Cloacimonadota bacterium]MCK9242366.1 type I methionyl aminopeptidase [Candidatus Cloacimonadota bacterium]